jgi:hypothetical protein
MNLVLAFSNWKGYLHLQIPFNFLPKKYFFSFNYAGISGKLHGWR